MDKTLTMKQWTEASNERRSEWLENDYRLDQLSTQVLDWAESFRLVGVTITDEQMTRVYNIIGDIDVS